MARKDYGTMLLQRLDRSAIGRGMVEHQRAEALRRRSGQDDIRKLASDKLRQEIRTLSHAQNLNQHGVVDPIMTLPEDVLQRLVGGNPITTNTNEQLVARKKAEAALVELTKRAQTKPHAKVKFSR